MNPIRLHVSLVFPEQENAKFDLDLELRGVRAWIFILFVEYVHNHVSLQIINVEKASVQMYGTKVEITLPKQEPGSWPKLNIPREILPAVKKTTAKNEPNTDQTSDDEFVDLDDIQSVNSHGLKLSELSMQNPNNLDW